MNNNGYLTKPEAAAYLGRSIRSLEKLMAQGDLPFVYGSGRTRPIALFRREDLERIKTEQARPRFPQTDQSRPSHSTRRRREEMYAQLQTLQRELRNMREDLLFAVESLLLLGGLSEKEAQHWIKIKLHSGGEFPRTTETEPSRQ